MFCSADKRDRTAGPGRTTAYKYIGLLKGKQEQGAKTSSLFDILQTKQLLFLCVKFFLGDNTAVMQFLILFQFICAALGDFLFDGRRGDGFALALNQ